jgi:putative hydrolase of the HAD superfamily
MTQDHKLLLFDLGNVIVEVPGAPAIQRLLAHSAPAEAVWNDFEMGLIEPEEFARRMVAAAALATEANAFLSEFEAWCGGVFPGMGETLAVLRPRFRLAALSNSNPVHWRRLTTLGLHDMFERAFSSHELGMRKPLLEIYEQVLRELGVRPTEVAFFDDLEVNVEAARRVGISAHLVSGPDALRACLRELGYFGGS